MPNPENQRCTFYVPHLPDVALSPNGRVHWAERRYAAKELRKIGQAYMLEALRGTAFHPNRARITVEYRHGGFRGRDTYYRPKDEDNAKAALKSFFDGIIDTGILPSDDRRYLEHGPTRIVHVDRYENEGLFVTVEVLA